MSQDLTEAFRGYLAASLAGKNSAVVRMALGSLAALIRCSTREVDEWFTSGSSLPELPGKRLYTILRSDGGREELVRFLMSDNPVTRVDVARWEATREFDSRLGELQRSIGTIQERLENFDKTRGVDNSYQLQQDFESLRENVVKLQQTRKDLTAPVLLPPEEDMQMPLVTANSFDRLEEYRTNQGIWSAFVGLFLGATLGLIINWATGSQVTRYGVVLMMTFLLVSAVFGYFYYQEDRRIEKVRGRMFHVVKGGNKVWLEQFGKATDKGVTEDMMRDFSSDKVDKG